MEILASATIGLMLVAGLAAPTVATDLCGTCATYPYYGNPCATPTWTAPPTFFDFNTFATQAQAINACAYSPALAQQKCANKFFSDAQAAMTAQLAQQCAVAGGCTPDTRTRYATAQPWTCVGTGYGPYGWNARAVDVQCQILCTCSSSGPCPAGKQLNTTNARCY